VASGSVQEIIDSPKSYTGKFLADKIKKDQNRVKYQGKMVVASGNAR